MLKFLKLAGREILVKCQETFLSCNFTHKWMINHQQIVSFGESSNRRFAELLQTARFPFDRDLRMLILEVASGGQQGGKPAIMLPGHSPELLRALMLHF